MTTEAQTRKELIDSKLRQAGWDVNNLTQVVPEFDISVSLPEEVVEKPLTPYAGHQYSDYVLLGRDGKPLAVVEAKKTSKDPAIGREQAKQYCYNIQRQSGGKLPFCFYTNGLEIYFWDLDNYPPRKVVGFPSRDDLERYQYIREHKKPLADELINTAIAGRDYQIRAIRAVMEGIEKRQRNFLLVMATGTGKTRTCIALVDALMRAGHAERILFLVDRIALREQGLAAFKEHLPNEPRWPKVGEKLIAKDRRIYISTYPTMLNIIRDQENSLSPHFFDLVVVDESHRSIYNTYGEVLDYFKAINFGGTQIEKTVINKGTNALIVKEFMEESIKDHNGVLPGKTIFFCSSISHARRIEKIFDSLYPEHKGELAKVLVSDDPRVYGKSGLLAQFTNTDMPRIALSVDMLDTGIDVREIVNLVFAKPVYSYTKFWQMIGRGTRLLESAKLKPWCTEKDRFLILDCWDNFEYFKLNPKGKENTQQIPLPVRFVGIRLDKIEKAMETGNVEIAQKESARLRQQIKELPQNSVVIQDAATDLHKIEDDNFWVSLTHDRIEYLRNTIKPLFRTISQTDFKAMRFHKDLLETSLAKLANEKNKFETLKDNVVEIISELPLSVNIVAREEALIKQAQTNHFWVKATDDTFDELAERLSPLIKYRDGQVNTTGPAQFDFTDLVKTKEMVEFGPEHEAVSISKYREMVETLIMELTLSNPILQKIK